MNAGDRNRNPNEPPAAGASPDDDASLYALGALDAEASDRIKQESERNPRLRREIEANEELVGALGQSAPIHRPPASLRAKVIDSARDYEAQQHPIDLDDARMRRAIRFGLGAVASLLILGLGLLSFVLFSEVNDRDDEIAQQREEIAQREGQLAEVEATVTAQQDEIAELQSEIEEAGANVNFEDPLNWTPFTVVSDGQQPTAYLVRSSDGRTGYIVVTDLPPDPEGVFQVWLIDGEPTSAGTFRTDDEGRGFLILDREDNVSINEFDLVGVTVEPPGGSPQPTSDPFLAVEITESS